MKFIQIILIVICVIFVLSISSESNKINKSNENESNLSERVQELVKENLILKQRLSEVNSKINSIEKNVNKQCNNSKSKLTNANNKIASSFLELKALSKTDPVFKSIVNFPLPREVSYLSLTGSNNNKMFSHLKLCPPGCIVGASG